MPSETSTPDIDRLRELVARAWRAVRSAQKASKGPWRKFRSRYGNDTVAIMQGEEPGYDESGNRLKRWPEIVTWMGFDGADTSETKRHADARAIVAAVNFVRDDLPRLLADHDADRAADKARIAELEGKNDRLQSKVDAFTNGDTFLYLRPEVQDKAAAELSDADLVKWVRWVLVKISEVYAQQTEERSMMEALAMHAVINLAKLVHESNSETAHFSVEGASWKGVPDGGDWTVTIARAARSALNSHADGASPSKETAA